MLDKKRIRSIAKMYSDEVIKLLNPVSIIMFGSCVNGNSNESSDIDIAVLVNNVAGEEWYNSRILLQKIRWEDDFFTEIEPHLLDKNSDPSGFVEHVIKTGEVIYEAC